ncbi:hypothetical protein HispidOSU_021907, partial [Sigmodon hispidus]
HGYPWQQHWKQRQVPKAFSGQAVLARGQPTRAKLAQLVAKTLDGSVSIAKSFQEPETISGLCGLKGLIFPKLFLGLTVKIQKRCAV